MAASSLLVLIDDIATLLDDVSALTKAAAKQTAGVLGDDLALNAEQVSGIRAERELPVVWAVAKGSLFNKAILVPAALAISLIAPKLIIPMLMLGGAYLCFEGFEKIAHSLFHKADVAEHKTKLKEARKDPAVDLVAFENKKVKGAIRTDFILSAEIIVITLGVVSGQSFITQLSVLVGIAILITVGVYGIVAGIVKLDDAGLYLMQQPGETVMVRFKRWFGQKIIIAAPIFMKLLSIVGTAAMFLVGGGILLHGIPAAHDVIHHLIEPLNTLPLGGVLSAIAPQAINGIAGVLAGAIVLMLVTSFEKIKSLIFK